MENAMENATEKAMTGTPPLIDLQTRDGIATLTLNRPQVRNALDDPMRVMLMEALDELAADRNVKAVVLTGSGKAFCAGGDIKAMQQRAQSPAGEVAYNGWSRQQRTHQMLLKLHSLPKPTIAAVNGAAAGLGADLAICCDFVIASASASFAWSYVLRGLIPDGGGLYFLPRRVGLPRAKDLIFSGRTLTAEEATTAGIADRLAAPEALLADAQAWASELGRNTGTALALAKSILDRSFESTPEEVFAQGSQAQAICYTTAEHQAAVAAFLDRSR
jgi:enoyl-CoA hydratase/carnithine racemase